MDHEFARNTPFGRPIAHGLLGMSLVAGLGSHSPSMCTLAFVKIREWSFLKPLYIQEPRQLLRLLATMARNRVFYWARKYHAPQRDRRRERSLEWAIDKQLEPASPEASPSGMVAGQELLSAFRGRLSEQEREIADERASGHDWATIAANRGSTPDAVRKRMARAFDRVARELGLESDEQKLA